LILIRSKAISYAYRYSVKSCKKNVNECKITAISAFNEWNDLFLTMRLKYFSGFAIVCLLLALWLINYKPDWEFEQAKKMIIIRKIGHEILLHSGDSTSRVLPVKKIAENEYQLQFENEFNFEPDSLVKTINHTVTVNKLPSHYVVNVIKCSTNEVVFGYAILGDKQSNIIPCRGRRQVKNCYLINLKFENTGVAVLQSRYLSALVILIFMLLFFLVWHYKRMRTTGKDKIADEGISIGRYRFYNNGQYLVIDKVKTELTLKETKVLSIFAHAPNQIIDRNKLQKEVWEDEGVIVGRSLDMFISKLRKKLVNDPSVKLVNIHGKGYKLEIHP